MRKERRGDQDDVEMKGSANKKGRRKELIKGTKACRFLWEDWSEKKDQMGYKGLVLLKDTRVLPAVTQKKKKKKQKEAKNSILLRDLVSDKKNRLPENAFSSWGTSKERVKKDCQPSGYSTGEVKTKGGCDPSKEGRPTEKLNFWGKKASKVPFKKEKRPSVYHKSLSGVGEGM